jgi:hypothetical protein
MYGVRRNLNGIFSILRGGCHWRMLSRASARGPIVRPFSALFFFFFALGCSLG